MMKKLTVLAMVVCGVYLLTGCGSDECKPACEGKQCGDDGCGGSCGTCEGNAVCTPEGLCQIPCEVACAGKECGNGGVEGCLCGPAGGECEAGKVCSEEFKCVEDPCLAICEGKCGTVDGCSCPECEPGKVCGPDNTCIDEGDPCIAACEGIECGKVNGCDCGKCEPGFKCEANVCVKCEPNCEGKECGDDGCGGSCGTCGEGLVCVGGVCKEPAEFGPTTFFNKLTIADPDCCFDLNDDDSVDNKLSAILEAVGGFLGDVDPNAEIAKAIEEGKVAALMEFVGVTDWVNQGPFSANMLLGKDADDDYTDNLDPATAGAFLADPKSFDPNTGEPLVVFEDVVIENGILKGGPSQFVVDVPVTPELVIHAVLDGARIEGAITADDSSDPILISITDGKVGGYVSKQIIFDGLNDYVANTCECLGLSGKLIENNTCASDGNPGNCTTEENKTCADMYQYCPMAVGVVPSFLDIDSDGDGENDSISMGITFESIPAVVVGIAPEE